MLNDTYSKDGLSKIPQNAYRQQQALDNRLVKKKETNGLVSSAPKASSHHSTLTKSKKLSKLKEQPFQLH